MKSFETLDPLWFKPFWYAAKELNFTKAAQSAGMTQSGVSQHIAKMETHLGVKLFERVNKKVLLTPAGHRVRDHIERYLEEVERLREELGAQEQDLQGEVSYAMPPACSMSPHFEQLLEQRVKRWPRLEIHVEVCGNAQVLSKLLGGRVDFGFLTESHLPTGLEIIPFVNEEYVLVSPSPGVGLSKEDLLKAPWVGYPGVEAIFEAWSQVQFPKARLQWSDLNQVGRINTIEGAMKMVRGGVGSTVVAKHCAQAVRGKGEITLVSGQKPVINPITIAYRQGQRLPRRVREVINAFLKMHEESSKRVLE